MSQAVDETAAKSSYRISRFHVFAVSSLLAIQAGLLAYSAMQHSPTHLEPAFLVSGLSQWEFGRFECYRVNPPLVRMVAALPVVAVGYQSDWAAFYDSPGARPEFPLGEAFLKANGKDVFPLFYYARWACIPFSLLGAYFAYQWARELYGPKSGLVAMILYVFEPNLLAHGELITPDAACTSFGILASYTFWRWLKRPTWSRAALAGGALGLAQLSKMSWVILFGLWPLLLLIWRFLEPKSIPFETSISRDLTSGVGTEQVIPNHLTATQRASEKPSIIQLATILGLAIYLMNLGYAFDGTGTPLKNFEFVSTALTGLEKSGTPGNRFRDHWLGQIPLPLPKQYVLGFDSQKKDFEDFGHRSYLRGEWRSEGWWYYYLYGLLVKVPSGIWILFALVVVVRSLSANRPTAFRDELVLLTPAVALLILVSSQTEFSIHLRYVFPSLGLALVFLGQAGLYLMRSSKFRATVVTLALIYSVTSSVWVYPNQLAYFNDFVGGPQNGHKHLLGSSLDWGQGIPEAITWISENEPSSHVEFSMFSSTFALSLLAQDHAAAPAVGSNQIKKTKLILYSADYYSDRQRLSNSPVTPLNEEILKRFTSGMMMVQVNAP